MKMFQHPDPTFQIWKRQFKKEKKKSHPQSQKVLDILRSARTEDKAGHKAPSLQERLQEAQEEDVQSTSPWLGAYNPQWHLAWEPRSALQCSLIC